MFEDSLDRFLINSRHLWYTNFLLLFCMTGAVLVCIYCLRKNKYSSLFLIYCVAGLLLLISNIVRPFIYSREAPAIFYTENGNVIFAITEYIIFSILFLQTLTQQWIKLLIYTAGAFILFLTAKFYYRYYTGHTSEKAIYGVSDSLISFELIVLGLLCLIYYFNLLRRKADEKLTEIPFFWIVTGLFPYAFVITPFFMIMTDEFRVVHEKIYYLLFIFHYISFSFLFICIIKALLCKKPLTT
jgi:hypothetical protein